MDGELVIGIDIGTTNLKAGLYDRNLDLVRSLKIAVTDMAGADAGAWNAHLVWQHAQKMLTAILQEDERQRLVAIGITGMAESGCLLDKHNQPTTPILLWHDRRGMRQAAAWRPLMADRLRSISGMRMTSVRSLAKWRWLVDHGASVTDRWCGAPEWLALCMTGTWLTDRTLAARTGAYNVIEGDYCEEILALAGAPSSLFPPAHLAPAVGGEMRSDVAVNLRLPKGVLVAIAGHDDIVAAYGAGGNAGTIIDSAGTAQGLVQVFNPPPNPEVVAKAGLSVVPFFQPGVWAALAGAGSTGALMEKVAGMLSSTPLELDRNATPSKAYPQGTLRVRLSTKGMPTVHLSDQATQEEIWSAVLDLVAERTGRAMRRIRHAAGRAERMIVVGGGARSAELCRRKKAIVKLPVQRRPAIEATTRGAAALAESAVKGKNI